MTLLPPRSIQATGESLNPNHARVISGESVSLKTGMSDSWGSASKDCENPLHLGLR